MPKSRIARERPSPSRGRRLRSPGRQGDDQPAVRPRPLVLMGLASLLLGVPLAVLGPAMGPYDDPKAWSLAILAALTGLAWVASQRHAPARLPAAPDRMTRVLPWIVLACLSWSVIATVASVAPAQSVLGTFGRGVGLLTIACAALLFFLARGECRTPGAVRSLVDVALLGSVPVCLLALGQAAGWDPLPKAWDPAVRTLTVRSTFGTHVFLGSYLVVLIPLAAARLEWAFRDRLEAGRWPSPRRGQAWRVLAAGAWTAGAVALIGAAPEWPVLWWALVPWGIVGAAGFSLAPRFDETGSDTRLTAWLLGALLAAQVLVVVLSRARGAFIGMLVGGGVTGLAFLVRRRAWKTLAAAGLGALVLLAFLVLLNRPGSPIAPLRKVPLLSRLGEIANVRYGSPGWVRVQLWTGIFDGWTRQLHGESVLPGTSPRIRSFTGYGPETQLIVLDPLTSPFVGALGAGGQGWRARYIFDRAHNVVLDRVVTEGFLGVGLWMLLVVGIVVVGVARLRVSASLGETTVRVGALGAVLGHLAEGQVGMETPVPLALFWIAAAVATSGSWTGSASAAPRETPRAAWWRARGWVVAMVITALVTSLVAWATTRWLLASTAYAEGVRRGIAGQLAEASQEFRRSVALAPWLPLPAESAGYTALRLATGESDPTRRAALLHEAQALVTQARHYALGGPGLWALAAQIAFAEARAGDRGRLATSREAFAVALRLRPGDPRLLAQSAWVWLESDDVPSARRAAEQAIARDPREWVAWAVLARASRAQGDSTGAERAAGRAREFAPAEARHLLETLLR